MCEIRDYTNELNMFQNKKVISFEIINYNYICKDNSAEQILEFDKKITNCLFEKAFFRGKYICLKFSNSDIYLLCYCGNYGKWDLKESKYDKLSISFNNSKIYFSDQKSFGSIIFTEKESILRVWDKIGIDVLSKEFTREKFTELFTKKIKKSCKSICNLLIDQEFISGLNFSVISDILYLANINPNTISKTLEKEKIDILYKTIKKIAIEKYQYKDRYQYKIYEKSQINGNSVEIFQIKKGKIYWAPENILVSEIR